MTAMKVLVVDDESAVRAALHRALELEEHDVVDTIFGELEQTPFDDETWHAKLTVMQENLLHHIEEEENEMFPKVRKLFDKETLESLGQQMQQIKSQARAA